MGLTEWFMERRRSRILDIALRQMTLALDTVADLEKAVTAAARNDKEEAKRCINRLFVVEEEVDGLRRTVFEEATKGRLHYKDREDLLHLVKRLDVMADHVKDSARNVLVLLDAEIPEEIWNALTEMSQNLVKCANTLRKSLELLGENPAKARELSKKVDDVEKVVDENYVQIKSLLLKRGTKIQVPALIILKDLLDFMENVADSCDDTADYVRVLTVGCT